MSLRRVIIPVCTVSNPSRAALRTLYLAQAAARPLTSMRFHRVDAKLRSNLNRVAYVAWTASRIPPMLTSLPPILNLHVRICTIYVHYCIYVNMRIRTCSTVIGHGSARNEAQEEYMRATN